MSARDVAPTSYIAAPALAKRWGLKTATLGKWRRLGKGPRGWYPLSPTFIIYPLEEVERFEAERRRAAGAEIEPRMLQEVAG